MLVISDEISDIRIGRDTRRREDLEVSSGSSGAHKAPRRRGMPWSFCKGPS